MRLLTAEDVAGILQVPKSSVYELIRLKRLPAVRIGRLVRVPEEELRAWIETGGTPVRPNEEGLIVDLPNLRPFESSRR